MLPVKPPGEPPRSLGVDGTAWIYSGGAVTLPRADLDAVLRFGLRWRARADVLEQSVEWEAE